MRRLLRSQHPDLADLPVTRVGRGWDNEIFRIGDERIARVPRREAGAALILHERRWLPDLLDGVPDLADGGLDASVHLRFGEPGDLHPWPWAVCVWHDGVTAYEGDLAKPLVGAERLGRFFRGLHRPAPPEAPRNPHRGVPLEQRSSLLVTQLDRLEQLGRPLGPGISRQLVERRWAELVDTPAQARPAFWLHGDMHPANLISRDGELVAVIDFGDLCAGDRATDLAVAWTLFGGDERARDVLRNEAGSIRPIDDATWRRAEAWALALSIAYLQGPHSSREMMAGARRTLATLLVDRD